MGINLNTHSFIRSAAFVAALLPMTATAAGTPATTQAPASTVTVANDPSQPIPVSVQKTTRRFVGFSDFTVQGIGAGVVYLNDLCNRKFTGSRMCTTAEVAKTKAIPPPGGRLGTVGWVQPVLESQGLVIDPDTKQAKAVVMDRVSGVSNLKIDNGFIYPGGLTCQGWSVDTTPPAFGLVVTAYGGYKIMSCGASNVHVACCAPEVTAAP